MEKARIQKTYNWHGSMANFRLPNIKILVMNTSLLPVQCMPLCKNIINKRNI